MVQVLDGWPANFWGPWCQDAAGVVAARRIDFAVEVMVDSGWECGIVAEVAVTDDK
jgi:hypothetical protein